MSFSIRRCCSFEYEGRIVAEVIAHSRFGPEDFDFAPIQRVLEIRSLRCEQFSLIDKVVQQLRQKFLTDRG